MGAKFSKDPDDLQMLIKDKSGILTLKTAKLSENVNKMEACTELPVAMEPGVQYLFLSDKTQNWHPHVYNNRPNCEVTANDILNEAEQAGVGKNAAHFKHTPDSTARFFNLNKEPVNKPDYPFFINHENRKENTNKRAFSECMPMEFQAANQEPISFNRYGIATVLYTDAQCTNEYIIRKERSPDYNENNRALDNNNVGLPYTDVKTFMEPAVSTNARYYRTYRGDYIPNPPSEYPV